MNSDFETLDISEKIILVDDTSRWRIDSGLLLQLATYNDYGADPSTLNEAVTGILEDGGRPMRVKLRIRVEAEYLSLRD